MSDQDSEGRLAGWFRRWRVPLRRFLKARGAVPAADLDDAAQEVFLRLMRYDRADIIEYPQAYLYKVASNVASEWAIRARNTHPHDSKWLDVLLAADQPEHTVSRDEMQDEVRRAIERLRPRQREVLKLHYSEGLGHAEIAERLGTTQRSVKRILIKSYHTLRHDLKPDWLGAIGDGR
jgi:RNA polymerase sigma-70 factor (ECF subfamily)